MSQESKPIKVLRREEPKQPLRNILELIKVMRAAHRRGTGVMSGEDHLEPSAQRLEDEKARTGEGSERPGRIRLFPILGKRRETLRGSSEEELGPLREVSTKTDSRCYYVDDYCIQHGQKRPCSGTRSW